MYRVPVDRLRHIPCLQILPVLQKNLTPDQSCAWDIWYGFIENTLYQSKSDDRFYLTMNCGHTTITTIYDTFDAAVDAIPEQIDKCTVMAIANANDRNKESS